MSDEQQRACDRFVLDSGHTAHGLICYRCGRPANLHKSSASNVVVSRDGSAVERTDAEPAPETGGDLTP